MKDHLDILSFHKLLQSDEEESALILALRQITEFKDVSELARDDPQPLGSWAGWQYN